MTRWALPLLALLYVGAVAAQERLQLVGEARLTYLFWPIYDSRLYSSDGNFRDGQRPLRLELTYLRDIPATDLLEQTRKEWQRSGRISEQEQQWLQLLSQFWPDVRENDVLALLIDEQERSTFLLNGSPLGEIADPAFGRRFLAIWLSPETSRPQMRLALIGKG